MSKAWKELDLNGEGLQAVNARIASQMRHRGLAYGLLALFPLGLHRWYLASPLGGLAYLALSAATLACLWTLGWTWALIPAAAELALLVFDLVWIDRTVTAYNKALRMRSYLRPGSRPPKDYRGRYSDADELDDYLHLKERERGGHQPIDMQALESDYGQQRRVPSFAEQEAMLRELARVKQRKADDAGKD